MHCFEASSGKSLLHFVNTLIRQSMREINPWRTGFLNIVQPPLKPKGIIRQSREMRSSLRGFWDKVYPLVFDRNWAFVCTQT